MVELTPMPVRFRPAQRPTSVTSNLTKIFFAYFGVRLEFSGSGIAAPVRVTVSRADYDSQRDNREWVIQFPAEALRVL